ncbi:glycosyltransferase [Patescibacteria group bacterium]|nr:glycosyltransferase [Patescibacteria group bacterium]MBU4367402.1 glycosyltransferase [Patescibacteria group bacterium]MBU4461722.1 glycosyltransferase [Patescibacteria group bacterium]MCG2700106.1 glycosyltransferase [Candidatus Parcubacteria bacterium]
MISIIVPTLNEEKYLPLLLDSIKKQNFSDYEIIVADAGSMDKTVEIAKRYGCRVIKGGLPAKGRNEGAKVAKGDLLFFLDADAVLPDNFFEKTLEEFKNKKLDFASFGLLPYKGKKIHRLAFNLFYNNYIYVLEKTLPHAAMGILTRKDVFSNLNGYDETIKLAEDHDLARRAKKIAKYGILKSTKIFVSDRRLRKEGWSKTAIKYLFCELHMILRGPVRSDIFKYKFDHYSKK